jgi:hypothetical protein
MKVHPFMVRLNAATGALNTAVNQRHPDEIARGLEDVGFWTARTVAEMISSSDEASTPSHLRLFKKGVSTLFEAQAANVRARKALRRMITPSTYSAPSSIENAGQGAFASRPFTPGETVGVVREKVARTGQPAMDWTFTYLSRQLNHSPRPNLKVVPVPGPTQTLAVMAIKPITADEELTVHYLDPEWPENDVYDLEIPPAWDQNALRATQTKDVTESAKMSAGLILGPLLLLASEQTSGTWATALVVTGSATSAWSIWKWLGRR